MAFSTLCWLISAAFSGSDIDKVLRRFQNRGVEELVDEKDAPDQRELWVIQDALFTWLIRLSSGAAVGGGRIIVMEVLDNCCMAGGASEDIDASRFYVVIRA